MELLGLFALTRPGGLSAGHGVLSPNAKVSGAGTASAGLPGWQANGETE